MTRRRKRGHIGDAYAASARPTPLASPRGVRSSNTNPVPVSICASQSTTVSFKPPLVLTTGSAP